MAAPSQNPTRNGSDPSSLPNTTFVQADPTTFRAVVQRLTGAASASPPFKLQERRPTARKLAIKLGHGGGAAAPTSVRSHYLSSPVSPLEYAAARGSPRSPTEEEEEKAIAEKGFYFHPSPRGSDPPELLPLFPLHSPRDN